MKLYWPSAEYEDANGNLQRLSTYDGCLDMASARKVIADWKNYWKYDLRIAWVDVYERSVLLQTAHIGVNNGRILLTENYQKE